MGARLELPGTGDAGSLVVGLVAGSHFVNHAYMMLLPALLPAIESDLQVTTAAIGLAIGVQGAVVTGLQLPFGQVSDRRSRELVLGVSLVGGAVGVTLTALAADYRLLLLAQAITGVGVAGHHPSHYPMLADATRQGERGRAYSVHGFTGSLGFAAPFVLAAVLLPLGFGWRVVAGAVAGGGALYAAACLWTVRRRVPASIRRPSADGGGDVSGLRAHVVSSLAASPAIYAMAVLALLTSVAGWGVRTYVVTLLTDGYHLPAPTATTVGAAMMVVGALAILLGGGLVDRFDPTVVLAGGFLSLTLVTAGLATGLLTPALAAGLALPCSATVTVSRPARSTLTDVLSGRSNLGRNFALLTVGVSGGGALAPPALGALADAAGIEAVFGAIAIVGILGAALAGAIGRRTGSD